MKTLLARLMHTPAVFAFVLVYSFSAYAQGPPGHTPERVRQVLERNAERLLAVKDVAGTAAGANAILVFLETPEAAREIPAEIEGVPVVVNVTGKILALAGTSPTDRFDRPVPIGVSTGNEGECSAGTISCRVTSGANVYALSNNHVYALENRAPIGSRVLQPGRYDTGCTFNLGDVIGTLYDFEPIVFSGTASNTIDAAIALSSAANLGTATPPDGYGTPQSTPMSAVVGEPVQKYGRTTALTRGQITGINATVKVGYSSGTARFVNQIIVESRQAFIKAGDSGSLLVTDPGRNPVGLLFAGTSTGKLAVANPIDLVLSRFGVTVDSAPPPPDTTPPAVTNVTPANGAAGVAVGANVVVTFSEPVNGVNNTTFTLSAGGPAIPSAVTVAPNRLSATLDPNADLAYGTLHTVTVAAGITDDAGNPMGSNFTSTFTTAAPAAGVSVSAITPNSMQAGGTVAVTVAGSGFVAGARLTFENGAGPTPTASGVTVVDANTITATVTVKSGGPRRDRVWDVRVTNPDGSSSVLLRGFTVRP